MDYKCKDTVPLSREGKIYWYWYNAS